MDEKLRMICRDCGSMHVTRDAWAVWDEDMQDWVLGSVYDHAFCHKCEEETKIEVLPL